MAPRKFSNPWPKRKGPPTFKPLGGGGTSPETTRRSELAYVALIVAVNPHDIHRTLGDRRSKAEIVADEIRSTFDWNKWSYRIQVLEDVA
jgi:hypothetical protein